MPVNPGCRASAGCCLLLRIVGSRGALMRNDIVYSFKGYDTTKHRYILRPAKATLERIRRVAGDHQALVHVSASEFLKLMANAPRSQISHHA